MTAHVLEDPPYEREERDEVEVDSQAVAEEGQTGREECIGVEARQKDPCIECPSSSARPAPSSESKRGEDADRGVARPLDRKVEPEGKTQKHPGDESEERKQHLTWAEDDLIRAAHVDVV